MKKMGVAGELFFGFLSLLFSMVIFIPQLWTVGYNNYINCKPTTVWNISEAVFSRGELIVLCFPLLCTLGVDILRKIKGGLSIKEMPLLSIFILLFIGYSLYREIYKGEITDINYIIKHSYSIFVLLVLTFIISVIIPRINFHKRQKA
jgi:hypothetical protein